MMLVPAPVFGPMLFTGPFAMFLTSLCMTGFLVYNIWAGGNPPPKGD